MKDAKLDILDQDADSIEIEFTLGGLRGVITLQAVGNTIELSTRGDISGTEPTFVLESQD